MMFATIFLHKELFASPPQSAEGTFILFKGGGLFRLFFDFQPVTHIFTEKSPLGRDNGCTRLLVW